MIQNRNANENTDDVISGPGTWSPFISLSGDVSVTGQGPGLGKDKAGQRASVSTETTGESDSHALGWGPDPWAAAVGFPGGQTGQTKVQIPEPEAQEN